MLMLAGGGEACTDIEALAAVLRPGNAGANIVVDHLTVLDTAIGQLPDTVGVGHHRGDDPELVARPVVVRADLAGCTHGFVWGCRARNVGFAVAARSNASVHAAISRVAYAPDAWTPTIIQAGERRDGAVCDVTDHIGLSDWPSGTRLIIRREPLHPGAQRSLFPSLSFRFWGHYTDQPGDPVDLDVTMRWRFWHAPARIIRRSRRHTVHITDRWPWADEIVTTHQRINALA